MDYENIPDEELAALPEEELAALFADIDIVLPPTPLDTLTEKLGLREVTTEEPALVLGVSDRRIAQLWQEDIIPEPRLEKKKYYFPLLQSVAGYINFIKNN